MSATASAGDRPSLSVIVTSYDSPQILEQCLTALTSQSEIDEVVVADCSHVDPTSSIASAFPSVKVLHFSTPTTVPKMRWTALARTHGALVAAIEGRSVPEPGWAADLVRAHMAYLDAPAIGGPVVLRNRASRFDWGLYWSEFGAFAPPVPQTQATQISGANLSYKRKAFDDCQDLLDAGVWETVIHDRWIRSGRRLRLCGATVRFCNGMSVGAAIRMRFHYGRSYAASRFPGGPLLQRLAYGAGATLLPWLMVWRTARVAHARAHASRFWKAILWVLALDVAWAAGEMIGYVIGPSHQSHVY